MRAANTKNATQVPPNYHAACTTSPTAFRIRVQTYREYDEQRNLDRDSVRGEDRLRLLL